MCIRDSFYMEKIAVGAAAKGKIDLSAPIAWNIEQVANAKDLAVEEVTVVILDRDRNTEIVDQIRAAGARIRFITDGDVVHVASVHQYDREKKTMVTVAGSGGVSPGMTALEGSYAFAWAQNIWADTLA